MTAPSHPGVIAPPPLLLLAALVAGFFLDRAVPLHVLAQAPPLLRWVVGGALIVAALIVNFQGFFRFQHHGTPVIPLKSSTKLVTDGIFAHLRNPMYMSMIGLTIGLGIAFAGDWVVIFGFVLWIALHYGVVRREERYLEAVFGEDYLAYKARVPRYGWRF